MLDVGFVQEQAGILITSDKDRNEVKQAISW